MSTRQRTKSIWNIIRGITGYDAKIDQYGSMQNRLFDESGAYLKGQKTSALSLPIVIASDQSTIPVSIGLPFFLSSTFGYATAVNMPSSAAINPLIYLVNPSGSGKIVYIEFLSFGENESNQYARCRLYKNPTVSANGTAKTVISLGGGTTIANLYETPTVTANGSLIQTLIWGQNNNSVIAPINFTISLQSNEQLLITGNPKDNNKVAEITLRWIEIDE